MIALMHEVRQAVLGPDRMWRGVRCSGSIVDYVQIKADPNPLPRLRLFRWLPS